MTEPMTDHPITPPPELRRTWINDSCSPDRKAIQAARWGADQELEACLAWLRSNDCRRIAEFLYKHRRPKPTSLKEQALAKTTAILNDSSRALSTEVWETLELTRRALETLND